MGGSEGSSYGGSCIQTEEGRAVQARAAPASGCGRRARGGTRRERAHGLGRGAGAAGRGLRGNCGRAGLCVVNSLGLEMEGRASVQKFCGLKLPQAISTRKHRPYSWAGVGAKVLLVGLTGCRVLALAWRAGGPRRGEHDYISEETGVSGASSIQLRERGRARHRPKAGSPATEGEHLCCLEGQRGALRVSRGPPRTLFPVPRQGGGTVQEHKNNKIVIKTIKLASPKLSRSGSLRVPSLPPFLILCTPSPQE